MLWGPIFLSLVLQTGEPGVGLGPFTAHEGASTAETALLILNRHTLVWGTVPFASLPSYQS